MYMPVPDELRRALDAFESEYLSQIIEGHQEAHFEVLRRMASAGPEVKRGYRNKAFYALGRWGESRVIPDIMEALPQLDDSGRIAAIDALGNLGTDQALEAISQYGNDPSPQVRKIVVQAWGRIGGAKAQEQLRSIADQDPEEWIRGLANQRIQHN